jgi:hypothetical protein
MLVRGQIDGTRMHISSSDASNGGSFISRSMAISRKKITNDKSSAALEDVSQLFVDYPYSLAGETIDHGVIR